MVTVRTLREFVKAIMLDKLRQSSAAVSVFIFGLYLMVLGTIIAIYPAPLLSLAGIENFDVVAHLMGMLTAICGYFYTRCGLEGAEMEKFFRLTTHTRSVQIIVLTFFVIFVPANPILLGFGFVDLAGCIWTFIALRKDESKQ